MSQTRSHQFRDRHAQLAAELGICWPPGFAKITSDETGAFVDTAVLAPLPAELFGREQKRAERRANWLRGDVNG